MRDAQPADRHRAAACQQRCHRGAQAALDIVLLHSDHPAGFPGRADDQFLVQRADGGQADDLRADACLLQLRAGPPLPYPSESRWERMVTSPPLVICRPLPNDKGLLLKEVGNSAVANAHVDRPHMLHHSLDGGADFVGVLGRQDGDAGDHAHDGKIIQRVVGRAQVGVGDAAVAADDF